MNTVNALRNILLALLLATTSTFAQNISGTVNDYAEVTGASGSVITVASAADLANFQVGDKILLFQMKGTIIDETNTASYGDIIGFDGAGNYELNEIATKSGRTLTLSVPICKNYKFDIHPVQIIRMPVYANPTIVGEITGKPWDGKTGGVIAFEATGTVTMQADINAESLGFRGGDVSTGSTTAASTDFVCDIASGKGGIKGEGIIDIPDAACRGKLANGGGGGNDHNSGGGGGANYGAGGLGGKGWPDEVDEGGVGGQSLATYYTEGLPRLFLGGGGGGGHQNNGATAPASNGGGIVLVRANTLDVATPSSISAQALNAPDIDINDGAGGGGAGGSILLQINNYVNAGNLTIDASGGDGASLTTGSGHGPGGGGGGGFVHSNITLPTGVTVDISGGQPGIFTSDSNPPGATSGTSRDAAAGQPGATLQGGLSLQVCSTPPTLDLDDTKSGNGYLSSFTGSSLPVANAGEVVITDADGTTIDVATVTLTNPLDGNNERLFVDNAATIQSTYGITVSTNASGHALTLSGTAPLANYQTVLGLVKYDNAAGAPNTADRVVDVVLNDGGAQSNTAQNRIGINAIPAKDTDGDGILDEDDLDDDNDGIPDNVEDPCRKSFAYNFSAEGWYTINNNNNGQVGSNPASHSTDPATGNDNCTISITGPANENIAGASPTTTNYIVDADPNGGLMYLRSPNFGGLDYRGLLGGTFQYDAYNYRVGYGRNGRPKNPVWIDNARATVYIYDMDGNSIRAQSEVSTVEAAYTAWENGSWSTFSFPINNATWSGNQAQLENVLANVAYISIRMEFINGGNTGNCNDVEYYAMDNVVLTSLPSCNNDDDGDGIPNSEDLDSDNDGIYDADEAGHGQPSTNGQVDGPVGEDGIPDAVQGNGNGGSGNTYYPPVLDLDDDDDSGAGAANYQTTFTEGNTDVAIADDDATLTDGDDDNLASLTVVLTNRPDGADEGLSVSGNLPAGISVSDAYDNGDGILTLSGSASVANYLTALKRVVYNNASENPDATDRTITVVANDGDVSSNPATTTLTVTPVNDAPTAADKTLTTNEETVVVVATTDLGYDDLDSDELVKITVDATPTVGVLFVDANDNDTVDDGETLVDNAEVTKAQLDAGQLKFLPSLDGSGTPYADFDFTVNDGTTDAAASSTITFNVTNINDAPTAADKRVNPNEDTDYVFAVADFGYADVDGDDLNHIRITDLPDNGTLFVDSDNDGTIDDNEAVVLNQNIAVADIPRLTFKPAPDANGDDYDTFEFLVNDGTDYSATANTITVDVTPVNDIPTAADKTVVTDEDTDYPFVVADFGYSDTESDPLDHIQIKALPTNGTLFVDTNNDGTVDTGETTTLDQDIPASDITQLKFRPAPEANGPGYDSFKFLVNDGTAYSATANTITVDVDAVNDLPTAADKTLTVDEDTPQTIATADLGYSDTDSDPLDKITINVAPTQGTLFVDSDEDGEVDGTEALADGDEVAQADLDAGRLKFLPAADDNGDDYADFDFTVNDGTADAAETNTITFDVTATNDAPTAASKTLTTDEDTPVVIATTDLGYSDTEGNALNKITISDAPTAGILFLDNDGNNQVDPGEELADNATVTKAQLDANQLKFLPASNDSGTPYDNFNFVVNDGTNDASAANEITFNVTAVNDAPTAADNTLTTDEDTDYQLTVADFGYSDPEGSALDHIQITDLPDQGVLFLDSDDDGIVDAGEAVVVDQDVTLAQISQLKFEPALNANGTGYDTFDFLVNDGTDYSAAAATITFDVTAVNDAPTATTQTLSATEDLPLTVTIADLGYSDTEGDALARITIDRIPANGVLFVDADNDGEADPDEIVSDNDLITRAQLDANRLKFVSAPDGNGPDYADFAFIVNDGTADATAANEIAFDVAAINDAPTATGNTLTTDEDTPVVIAATDLGYSDTENDALNKITVSAIPTVGTLFLDNDGDGEANEGALAANATVTKAQLDANLLKFLPADNESGVSYADFDFIVNDGALDATAASTITFDVTAINDAPTASDQTVTTNEDTDYPFTVADFGYTDTEGTALDHIQVTDLPDEGVLFVDTNNDGTVDTGEVVSVNDDIAAGDLTQLKFKPAPDANGDDYDTFEFLVNDGTDYSATANTITVDVTAVNDAPTAANNTLTTDEDTPVVIATADLGYNDVEGDALSKITVNTIPAQGTLFVDADGDGEVDGPEALANGDEVDRADLDAGRLQFVPAPDETGDGYANFTFSVNDGTADAATASTITFDVDEVNDAPTAADKTLTTNEDTPVVIATTDLGYDDTEGDALSKITVSTAPVVGTLFLDADNDGEVDTGEELTDNAAVTKAQLDASRLKFLPAPNDHGLSYDTFDFVVNDGTDDAVTASTITFDVTAVNDAPMAADGEVDTNEDEAYTFSATDFSANYLDKEGDAFAGIKITGLETTGTLTLDGTDIVLNVNDVVSLADLNSNQLVFLADANESGDAYATFKFQVADSEGAYSDDYTMTVNVAPVGDAPLSADATVTATEDVAYDFTNTDFAFSDAADNDDFATVIITGLPATGTLSYNGTVVTSADVTNETAFADRSLFRYRAAPDGFGDDYTTFTFRVVDDADDQSNEHTITVDVDPVNDAPAANNGGNLTVAADEEEADIPLNLATPSDVDDDDNTLIIEVSQLPTLGTVTLANGDAVVSGQTLTAAQLAGLQYDAPEDYNGSVNPVTFAYTVSDGEETTTQTVDFNLSTVNDAPVANNGGDVTITTDEEAENIELNLAAPSDVDDDDNSLTITLTQLPNLGVVTLANGDAVASGQTLTIAELTGLQYDAPADYNGTDVVQDLVYTVSDGDRSVTQNVRFELSAINDAPTAANGEVNTDEDVAHLFSATDFSADYLDTEGDAFAGIRISGLETAGTLTFRGSDVVVGEVLSVSDLDDNQLVFTADENQSGDDYATFTFQVADSEGAYSGDYTMTVDVTPVGDAPVSADATVSTPEDQPYSFANADFAFADDADGNTFAGVVIRSLPGTGTLLYDGNPVSEADVTDETLFADRTLFAFGPVAHGFGDPYATFDFAVRDNAGDVSEDHTLTVIVTSVNDRPVVTDVPKSGTEDTVLPFTATDFTDQFSDVEDDALAKIQIKSLPDAAAGVLQLNGVDVAIDDEIDVSLLDQLTFVPNADFNGPVSFAWNGSDGSAYADNDAQVNITLDATDDLPVVREVIKSGDEDTVIPFTTTDFSGQFDDADGDALATVRIVTLPPNATLRLGSDAVQVGDEIAVADLEQLTLVPDEDFFGDASFTWNGSDGNNYATDDAAVTVSITAAPDAPTVSEVSKSGPEDETVGFSIDDFIDQFDDVDGDGLVKIQIKSLPDATTEGVLRYNGTDVAVEDEIGVANLGQLTFVPAPDFHGEVSFDWTGSDGTAYADPVAPVTITIEAVNDPPTVASVDKPNGEEDQAMTFTPADFTSQFSDVDGDTLVSVRIVTLPVGGTLLLDGVAVEIDDEIGVADLAKLTLVPDANVNGVVSFTWSGSDGEAYADPSAAVNVTFAPVPDAPTVTDVVKEPVDEEQTVSFAATDFSDQFSDADGEALATVQITRLPANGTLQLNGADVTVDQEILRADVAGLTLVPDEHYYGPDSIGWNGSDGTTYAEEAAHVRLTFRPVQDAPTVSDVTKTAATGFAMTFTPADFGDQFADVDDEPLANVQITRLPNNGILYLNGVAVNLNDAIAADDLASLTYVPADGYAGSDSFDWSGSDGTEYAAPGAQVLIEVLPQEPPVLSDVAKTSDEDETVTFAPDDFVSQFDDPDNDPLAKIRITSLPTVGTLTLNGTPVAEGDEIDAIDLNQLAFVPPADFHGTVSFGWNGYDGFQYADDEALVNLTINSVPDRPELSEVEKRGEEDQPLSFTAADFSDQFSDADGDILTKIQVVSLPENGTLQLNGVPVTAGDEIAVADLNQLTFVPAEHFAGTVTFAWNGYDSTAYAAEPATVTLIIGEQNDGMPVATTATFQTDENSTLTGSLAEFIADPEGRGVIYATTPTTAPEHGTLTLNADGTFTYVPNADYRGKDTFTYRVCDRGNPEECTEGTVKLIVGEPDDDEDGIPDMVEKGDDPQNPTDSDGDGVPDYQDDDSDNDGIPDGQEAGDNPAQPVDTDGDGTPDYQDTDSDNDGIPDTQEAGDNPTQPTDSDGDGTPDYRETDSDNDGLTDTQEAGDDLTQPTDTDGDGVPDYQDTDSDGDTVADADEVGADPLNPRDTDQDGIPNYQETDSDGDGVPDDQEDVITIFEGFSPNSDSKNDGWYIDGIEDYPENTVQIFNRWGNKVYEIKGYNNKDRAWSSESSIGLIIGDTEVPDGTYFYIIDLKDGKKPRSGYVIVNR